MRTFLCNLMNSPVNRPRGARLYGANSFLCATKRRPQKPKQRTVGTPVPTNVRQIRTPNRRRQRSRLAGRRGERWERRRWRMKRLERVAVVEMERSDERAFHFGYHNRTAGPYGLEGILNFANRNLPCIIFCSVKREDTVLPYEFVILLYRAYRNYRCKNDGFIKIG